MHPTCLRVDFPRVVDSCASQVLCCPTSNAVCCRSSGLVVCGEPNVVQLSRTPSLAAAQIQAMWVFAQLRRGEGSANVLAQCHPSAQFVATGFCKALALSLAAKLLMPHLAAMTEDPACVVNVEYWNCE